MSTCIFSWSVNVLGAGLCRRSLPQTPFHDHWERENFLSCDKKEWVRFCLHRVSLACFWIQPRFKFLSKSLSFTFSVTKLTESKELLLQWDKKEVLSWRNKWLKDRTQRIKVFGGRSPVESHWAALHVVIIIYYIQCIPRGMHWLI